MTLREQLSAQLNPPQSDATFHTEGPLLILAGAGSGKTRVLTYRMVHLIASGEAAPGNILAVTFTNKAAREMRNRIQTLLDQFSVPIYEDMWIGTFHATCARILREHITMLDYKPFFGIYDDGEQLGMVKKVMEQLNINDKVFPAKAFKAAINDAKTKGLTPSDLKKRNSILMNDQSLSVYEAYEDAMKRANALDFGDLLLKTYDLFRYYPDLLSQYQERFRFIMVDEYQDTNHIQYLLVKMLAEKFRNLCVVGDEDQSIYSWRGADISNILDFEKDFPEAKVVKLEENYRSSQNIVAAATHLIRNNTQRKDKTLFTSNVPGDKIIIREERTDYDEARFVVERIKHLRTEEQETLKDMAIFYRTNAQSRVLEDVLRSNQIPYKMVGGMRFYERMEIKDALGYMKLLLNPTDDMAAQRIINVPGRGIGKTTIEKIQQVSNDERISFLQAIQRTIDLRLVHSGAASKLRSFLTLFEKLQLTSQNKKSSEVFQSIIDETGYVAQLRKENTPEAKNRIENLEEFYNAILQFEDEREGEASLQNFLEEMALVSDADSMKESDEGVTLMTLHISKGLEYPNVFIVGMEEGLFPSIRSVDEMSGEGLEEERRLAYVGMTRAEKRLFLLHAQTRRIWGQEQTQSPSRFLDELPKELVDTQGSIIKHEFLKRFRDKYGNQDNGQGTQDLGRRSPSRKFRKPGEAFDEMPDYENDAPEDEESIEFSKGMRVRHPTFGIGNIFQVEGTGENLKVSVMFSDRTTKKFVAKYARLEVLA